MQNGGKVRSQDRESHEGLSVKVSVQASLPGASSRK